MVKHAFSIICSDPEIVISLCFLCRDPKIKFLHLRSFFMIITGIWVSMVIK